MAHSLARLAVRRLAATQSRALSLSAAQRKPDVVLSPEQRDKIYPRIGSRDVVGFGFNGTASYMDREEYPFPAIRFKNNTDDVLALKEKEKGDWKNMSIEEKKELYRASFRQTFAEMGAPSGEWKSILAATFLMLSLSGWVIIFMKKFVYPPPPPTITPEWAAAEAEYMVKQRQGLVEGIGSKWDYEKGQWKN